MIYFDNAASGGFKPSNVIDTTVSVIKYLNANTGRSLHRLSQTASSYVYSCRKKVAEFFNAKNVSRVIFTKNCTEAINLAIHGGIENGKVLTTTLEHNSVLRPLFTLEKKGDITLDIITPKNKRFITASDIESHYDSTVSAVVINASSNVTGECANLLEIGEFLKNKKALFIVDGAQAGGHIPIDVTRYNIDMLALAGHKGLYSIQGIGVLILSDRVTVNPLMEGGTGTESFNPFQPDVYPEKLESGTLNLPAICSLEEGIRYVENSLSYVSNYLLDLTGYLIDKLGFINGVTIYSNKNPVGIVSFAISNLPSGEVTEILSNKYDIAVRGGFHCAPLIHKMLNTDDGGLIRVSLSPHNTKREVNALISAIKEIANSF
jgi:cysteine desulfurase family protein